MKRNIIKRKLRKKENWEILEIIAKAIELNPDLRFEQLLINFQVFEESMSHPANSKYYIKHHRESSELLDLIKESKFFKELIDK